MLLHQISKLEGTATTPQAFMEVAKRYEQLRDLYPNEHQLIVNQGNALWLADCPAEALACYQEALQIQPESALAYRGLANVLTDLGKYEAADRAFVRSLRLRPDPETNWNRSQLLIGLERYQEGYGLAECRWDLKAVQPWRGPTDRWAGPDTEDGGAAGNALRNGQGRPLLVWSEQGLGDTLQHLRWLAPLQAIRGAGPLVLEVEACLVRLLEQALPDLGPGTRVVAKSPEGPMDWEGEHISLLSLPWLLGGAPLPEQASWLQAAHWSPPRRRPLGKPRIGLVWAAGRKLDDPVMAREYWRRSLDGAALGRLIEGLVQRGAECVPLQFGEDRDQAAPWGDWLAEALSPTADFAATADRVAELDLVISVDTAMAHLVGAMRRPLWLLLPFSAAPRWGAEGCTTAWYGSMRLFRQKEPGDWQSAVDQILEASTQWRLLQD
jgi:tetratricopeptide (TPR) repeat protein